MLMSKEKTADSILNRIVDSARSAFVKKEVVRKEVLGVTSLKEIHIAASDIDVEVMKHQEANITIVFTSYEDGPEMLVDHTDDVLDITFMKTSKERFIIEFSPTVKMQLFVPDDIAEGWKISTRLGDVTVSQLSAKAISVHTASGDASLSDIKAHQIKLHCTSGDIQANKLRAEECYLQTSSGDIEIAKLVAGSTYAKAASGDLTLTDIRGEHMEIALASGDVELEDVIMVKGMIDVRSGDVEADRIQVESLTVDTKSGDVELNEFSGGLNGKSISGDFDLGIVDYATVQLDSWKGDIAVEIDQVIGLNAAYDIAYSSDMETNLPFERDGQSRRLTGVTGDGENSIRIKSSAGDIKIYTKAPVNV